ncbi:hypothetical protein BDZ89DRAFT_1043658 [Hymenopellis radicata]|nr:hypothetical protein BDZ89DRAFT_1043658 [Hymenopellis radicata]
MNKSEAYTLTQKNGKQRIWQYIPYRPSPLLRVSIHCRIVILYTSSERVSPGSPFTLAWIGLQQNKLIGWTDLRTSLSLHSNETLTESVHRHTRYTFYDCSLVCSTWTPIAQRLLYHTIRIYASSVLISLQRHLVSFPRFAAFIRVVYLQRHVPWKHGRSDPGVWDFATQTIPRLTAVHTLILDEGHGYMDEAEMDVYLLKTFVARCRQLCMIEFRRFRLISVNYVLSSLRGSCCRSLAIRFDPLEPDFQTSVARESHERFYPQDITFCHAVQKLGSWFTNIGHSSSSPYIQRMTCIDSFMHNDVALSLNNVIQDVDLESLALIWDFEHVVDIDAVSNVLTINRAMSTLKHRGTFRRYLICRRTLEVPNDCPTKCYARERARGPLSDHGYMLSNTQKDSNADAMGLGFFDPNGHHEPDSNYDDVVISFSMELTTRSGAAWGLALLPPELVCGVVEHYQDLQNLVRWSLINRAWRVITQKELYNNLDFKSASDLEIIEDVIESFPHLACLVHHISFNLQPSQSRLKDLSTYPPWLSLAKWLRS